MHEFEHERDEKKGSADCKSVDQTQVLDPVTVGVVQSQVQLSISGLQCESAISKAVAVMSRKLLDFELRFTCSALF